MSANQHDRSFDFHPWILANWCIDTLAGEPKYFLRFPESLEFESAERNDLRLTESRDLRRHNGGSADPTGKRLEPGCQIDHRTNGREIEPVRAPDVSVVKAADMHRDSEAEGR